MDILSFLKNCLTSHIAIFSCFFQVGLTRGLLLKNQIGYSFFLKNCLTSHIAIFSCFFPGWFNKGLASEKPNWIFILIFLLKKCLRSHIASTFFGLKMGLLSKNQIGYSFFFIEEMPNKSHCRHFLLFFSWLV